MYPVHGAAVAFFDGKFWVFGGSTGNDNYDHTITDKVGKIQKHHKSIIIHKSFMKLDSIYHCMPISV